MGRYGNGVRDLLPKLLIDRREDADNDLRAEEIQQTPGECDGKNQPHGKPLLKRSDLVACFVPFWDVLR